MSEAPAKQYGGQALIEGVMIRGARHVCIACRQHETDADGKALDPADSPLFVQTEVISTFAGRLAQKYRWARWPLIRGSLVLLESMELGSKGLRLSASVALESTQPKAAGAPTTPAVHQQNGAAPTAAAPSSDSFSQDETLSDSPSSTAGTGSQDAAAVMGGAAPGARSVLVGLVVALLVGGLGYACYRLGWLNLPGARAAAVVVAALAVGMAALLTRARQEEHQQAASLGEMAVGATMVVGLAVGIGIFFLLPYLLASLFRHIVTNPWLWNFLEGLIRVALFFGYLKLISRLPNIRRIFEYHGAEHQVIHVHENGLELVPENAARFSTIHPRCGTAFLAIVLVMSVIVFTLTGRPAWWLGLLLRVVLLPVIGGVSYELLKWNARHPNPVLKAFAAPGLWFQKITTQPPSRDQVEVAIAAMSGVLTAESHGDANTPETEI